MKLFMLRHAQSEHNASQSDHLDSHITFYGIQQAQFLASQLNFPSVHVYCSPYTRCRQTFEVIKSRVNVLSYTCTADIREGQNVDSGWNHESRVEIEDNCAGIHCFEKLETREQFDKRVKDFITRIIEQNQDVMIVSHAGVIRRIRKAIDTSYKPNDWKVKNCELFVYEDSKLVQRICKD